MYPKTQMVNHRESMTETSEGNKKGEKS